MATLDLSQTGVVVEQKSHPRLEAELKLGFTGEAYASLLGQLEPVLGGRVRELRVELPSGWTLFWKLREAENRILVAHPEEKLWVATLALDAERAPGIHGQLAGLQPGQELRLGSLPGFSRASNLDVIICRA